MNKNSAKDIWMQFYTTYSSQLYIFAKGHARSAAEAEDILHDVFIKALEWIEEGRDISPGWLFNKIRYTCIDYARREDRRLMREGSFVEEVTDTVTPANDSEGKEAEESLQLALEQIPNDQADVVIMKVWSDLTFEEIGAALEISPNTAASRYRYGLENLKKRMEEVSA